MRGAGSLYLIFVGLMFCGAGGVFGWLMWRSYDRAAGQQEWMETPCVIIESEVEERKIGAEVGSEFRFAVLYGYEVEGTPHTSDRYSLRGSPWSGSAARAEHLAGQHEAGSQQTCFVDPAEPEFAVLKRDSKAPVWFPLLIVAGGLGMIVGAVRAMLRKSAPANGAPTPDRAEVSSR